MAVIGMWGHHVMSIVRHMHEEDVYIHGCPRARLVAALQQCTEWRWLRFWTQCAMFCVQEIDATTVASSRKFHKAMMDSVFFS